MLVERNVQVMNVDVVGQAYAIAANYLCKGGFAIDPYLTDQTLLEIIVQLFHRGDRNSIRIANRAIVQFQAAVHG
jgi:hypothetical protein